MKASLLAHLPPQDWRASLRSLLAAVVLSLVACGGGVETGGTGAYVQGPVSGFGSIIVAGVRFDERRAAIEDAEGGRFDGALLRLGMMVEIDSGPIRDDGSGRIATATRVRLGSQLLGVVTALDLDNGQLSVMGQTVRLTPATVIDDGLDGGATALRLDDVVEVHGFFVAASNPGDEGYVATRLERRNTTPLHYRVQGIVRDLQAQATPPTLRIGTQLFDLTGSGVPVGLTGGQFVRLILDTRQMNERWPVERIVVRQLRPEDREEAELEGLITAFESAAEFSVNGLPVQTTASTNFVDGSEGLGLGVRLEVHGRTQGGVLLASEVDIKSDDDVFNEGVDIRDLIASVDEAAQTFVLRGVTVFYGSVPPSGYDNGSAADLPTARGRLVRVRATLSTDRTQIVATRIEFLD